MQIPWMEISLYESTYVRKKIKYVRMINLYVRTYVDIVLTEEIMEDFKTPIVRYSVNFIYYLNVKVPYLCGTVRKINCFPIFSSLHTMNTYVGGF